MFKEVRVAVDRIHHRGDQLNGVEATTDSLASAARSWNASARIATEQYQGEIRTFNRLLIFGGIEAAEAAQRVHERGDHLNSAEAATARLSESVGSLGASARLVAERYQRESSSYNRILVVCSIVAVILIVALTAVCLRRFDII
ncbi:hypothetical protein AAVH_11433 [Aphelenchoides avenae]|nr:hypothetical protein AAVH_11433 [Aphelenchus avenae]